VSLAGRSSPDRPAYTLITYRYRPSPDRSYTTDPHSSTPPPHMMYSYSHLPMQAQQQPQTVQHMSRPSPPQTTWAVPQTHNPYYPMPRGPTPGSRDEPGHLLARSEVSAAHSPAMIMTTYSSGINDAGTLATTDYFPGVIDTSKCSRNCLQMLVTNKSRPVGPKGMRRIGLFPLFRSGGVGLQPPWHDGSR
jgi:hypothetical protein